MRSIFTLLHPQCQCMNASHLKRESSKDDPSSPEADDTVERRTDDISPADANFLQVQAFFILRGKDRHAGLAKYCFLEV